MFRHCAAARNPCQEQADEWREGNPPSRGDIVKAAGKLRHAETDRDGGAQHGGDHGCKGKAGRKIKGHDIDVPCPEEPRSPPKGRDPDDRQTHNQLWADGDNRVEPLAESTPGGTDHHIVPWRLGHRGTFPAIAADRPAPLGK